MELYLRVAGPALGCGVGSGAFFNQHINHSQRDFSIKSIIFNDAFNGKTIEFYPR
jgi:hypothetical protein